MVGDVVKNRIDAQRDSMVEQETNRFADIVAAEEATKAKLVIWGISTMLTPFYLSFARQCYSVTQKHAGAIAVTEICIKANAWHTRGLNMFYLAEISEDVFSVVITSCTASA
jgi:hypothetical protein